MKNKLIELILSDDFENCSLASEILQGWGQDEIWEIVETFTQQETHFQKIGFSFHKVRRTEVGVIFEFKNYPEYLKDSHYTLVIFSYLQENLDRMYKTEYRLYEHSNEDGRYIKSPFQCSHYYVMDFLEKEKAFKNALQ